MNEPKSRLDAVVAQLRRPLAVAGMMGLALLLGAADKAPSIATSAVSVVQLSAPAGIVEPESLQEQLRLPQQPSLDNSVEAMTGAETLQMNPRLSLADLVDATAAQLPKNLKGDLDCLARAVYYESRGEPLKGQLGVAQVILNRMNAGGFGETVCAVISQRTGAGGVCQFAFACTGRPGQPQFDRSWYEARAIAAIALSGAWKDVTDRAMYFHAVHASPSWRRRMQLTATLGQHRFYRP